MTKRIYLHNHGNPTLPLERRTPYPIRGTNELIPVGGRVEVTDDILGYHAQRIHGEEGRLLFAQFLEGHVNANREPKHLELIEETEKEGTDDDPAGDDTANAPGASGEDEAGLRPE